MGRPKKNKNQEPSNELELEEMEISGIKLKEFKKIDKLGNGMYIIELAETGLTKELSLDKGEAELVDHYLNRHLNNGGASISSDEENASSASLHKKVDLPSFNREALERNLGNSFEVEFVDPDIGGYWAIEEDIKYYISTGYTYAKSSMIKFFESSFGDMKPGEGFSPDGRICINGHTLLVAKKSTQQQLQDYHYSRRQGPKDRQFYMSPEELAKAGV